MGVSWGGAVCVSWGVFGGFLGDAMELLGFLGVVLVSLGDVWCGILVCLGVPGESPRDIWGIV